MLATILRDMWVDPEVLEALNEDQKKILFFKMREEQVRRWREHEEKEEKEERKERDNNTRPKKACSKRVSWLLGRDGDVSVSIIGEVDESRFSRLPQNLKNNRLHSDNMTSIQTVDLMSGREDQQLSPKEDIQLSLTQDNKASPNDHSSEEDSCSADDDLKDTAEDSDSESGTSSGNPGDWAPSYRPHFSSHGNQPLRAPLVDTERTDLKDRETVCYTVKTEGGGHVEQLRKKFTNNHHNTSTAYKKPPIPAKPAHLQKRSSPLTH